jgi:cleavage stimulation factor subunit 3
MDGSLPSAQQPLQLSTNVGVGSISIAHDSPNSISTQRVSDPTTELKPEESSPNPELPTSEVVQTTTADILQVLQKLQAQQSATPPTPQLPSFPAKPELQPQSAPVLPKEEPQPATPSVTEESVSEWDTLRASLRDNPHDTEGWNKLVRLAEDSADLEKIKEAYESLLKMYPNTVRNLQSVVNQVLLT